MVRNSTLVRLFAVGLVTMLGGEAVAKPIAFLVGEIEPAHGLSYVLPLEDPGAITHARQLIDEGISAGQPLVVARIAEGFDGINRDHRQPGSPAWSWHVSEFVGFADVTAEILDGNPRLVEDDVDGWIANTQGQIGFWNYTVVQELGVVPEPSAIMLFLAGVALLILGRCKTGCVPGSRLRLFVGFLPHGLDARRATGAQPRASCPEAARHTGPWEIRAEAGQEGRSRPVAQPRPHTTCPPMGYR